MLLGAMGVSVFNEGKLLHSDLPYTSDEYLFIALLNTPTCKIDKSILLLPPLSRWLFF
uniref:Uncharacterized protein n=2 Tax=Vibrio harveyi group TaxID=717610 RepID=A0A1S6KSG8_9VIBR|nr:hypothetical protein [Vibrio owensii]